MLLFGRLNRLAREISAHIVRNFGLLPLMRQITSLTAAEIKHADVLEFTLLRVLID